MRIYTEAFSDFRQGHVELTTSTDMMQFTPL